LIIWTPGFFELYAIYLHKLYLLEPLGISDDYMNIAIFSQGWIYRVLASLTNNLSCSSPRKIIPTPNDVAEGICPFQEKDSRESIW